VLCTRKAHYAAERLGTVPGVRLRFERPFFKEFALHLPGDVPALLTAALAKGYHAGLSLGRWYPDLGDGLLVAVTEKRTRAEIDGLAETLGAQLAAGPAQDARHTRAQRQAAPVR
jgi:glycine dehydrogenase subunit 1